MYNAKMHDVAQLAPELEALKAAAGGRPGWWTGRLAFNWAGCNSKAACIWVDLTYDGKGIKLKFRDEVQSGDLIMKKPDGTPLFVGADGVAKPSLSINCWTEKVETEADGITLLSNPDGTPKLPPRASRSNLFTVLELLNEAFRAEVEQRLDNATLLVSVAKQGRKAGKTAEQVHEDFLAGLAASGQPRARVPRDLILSKDQYASLQQLYAGAELATLVKDAIQATTISLSGPISYTLSNKNIKNPGALRPNPRARLAFIMPNAQAKFMPEGTTIKDASQRIVNQQTKKPDWGLATLEGGEPVTAYSVDGWSLRRSKYTGIATLSICFSSLSIGLSAKLTQVVVERNADGGQDTDELNEMFDEEDLEGGAGGPPRAAPAAPPAAAGAAAGAAASAAAAAAAVAAAADPYAPGSVADPLDLNALADTLGA